MLMLTFVRLSYRSKRKRVLIYIYFFFPQSVGVSIRLPPPPSSFNMFLCLYTDATIISFHIEYPLSFGVFLSFCERGLFKGFSSSIGCRRHHHKTLNMSIILHSYIMQPAGSSHLSPFKAFLFL